MKSTDQTHPSHRAQVNRLMVAAVLAMLAALTTAIPTGAAVGQERSPSDIFEQHCQVEGALRTIPLSRSTGGKVGKLIAGTGAFVELDQPLPPGSYRATYLSYDAYPGREHVAQPAEIWEVLFLAERTEQGILATLGPTADLADNVPAAYASDWPAGAVSTVTTADDTNYLGIRHAAPADQSTVNSVQPICLVLFGDGVESPPEFCDAADIIHTNPEASFGSEVGKLWNRSGSRVLVRFDPPLAAGVYQVVGGSYDGYPGRAEATWERAETWVAEFWSADDRLLAVSGSSEDLPDGTAYEEASWEGSMGRVDLDAPAERVVVRHTNPDGTAPNSVHVACLGLTADDGPTPGLPAARPAAEIPWSEIGSDWLLTVVHGEVTDGVQPQGLYLVDPDGDRWVAYSAVRDPRVEGLTRILDWDVGRREALVLVSGPRDMEHIARFNLESGAEQALTDRIGGFVPDASYLPSNADALLVLDVSDDGHQQLEIWSADGTEGPAVGPKLPLGTRYDWIESTTVTDFVIADGFAVGAARGRVMYYPGPLYEARPMAFEDCIPVRWVVAGLASVCDSVAGQPGQDLWVIPTDGSQPWPVVHPEVTSTLGVDGFRDLYADDGRLILESAVGDVWELEEGCGVPTRLSLPAATGRLDLLGAIDGDVNAHHRIDRQLVRLTPLAADARLLLDGVVDAARGDAGNPVGTAAFPAAPSPPDPSGPDGCRKAGDGQAALLTDIRWAHHPEHTRVVFDFENAPSTPGWTVQYIAGPINPENPTGPTIVGDGLLSVTLRPSSRVDLSDPDNIVFTYDGPTTIDIGTGSVARISIVEDFEGYLEWVIEVDGRKPFSAFTLSSPPRLVLDIDD